MLPFLVTTTDLTDWLIEHGSRIAGIIIAVGIADFLLQRLVPRAIHVTVERRLTDKTEEEVRQRADTLSHVLTRTGRSMLLLLGLFTILPEVNINIGPLLAGVGIVGIAVGFGAQSLVKDFISGLFILLDNQYGKGDVVRVAGISGQVEDVGLRRTVLRDLDGIVHYVPNGEIAVASNLTQEFSRVNLNVSVSYAEDLDQVMAVINRVGEEMARDPVWGELIIAAPRALRVDNFGDSGIEVKIVGDTLPIRQWEVMGELRRRLKIAFDREGIEIPFPHRVMVPTAKAVGAAPEPSQEEPAEPSSESE